MLRHTQAAEKSLSGWVGRGGGGGVGEEGAGLYPWCVNRGIGESKKKKEKKKKENSLTKKNT